MVTDTCPQPYKFTGKERDTESNLDYFGARHYSSTLGRFVQADTPMAGQFAADPQSWNLYAYARNNPQKYTDPSGRVWKLATLVVKVAHAAYKGYDVYSTVSGVAEGVKTVFSGDARVGTGERLKAAASVIGELSGATDLYKGAKALTKGAKLADKADDAADATKTSNIVGRKSSATIRKEWEEANGQPWPKDSKTGKNMEVSHEQALADGGTNELSNIKPRPHDEHVQMHVDNGDFKLWGERAKKEKE